MSTNFILLTSFNFNEFRPHFYLLVDKQQICYLFLIHLFPYFMLLPTTILIFFSRTTCSGCSHIISIIYTYSIIRISLFIKLGNICIICIYDITCTISISLTCTYCGHCPHPFIMILYHNLIYHQTYN